MELLTFQTVDAMSFRNLNKVIYSAKRLQWYCNGILILACITIVVAACTIVKDWQQYLMKFLAPSYYFDGKLVTLKIK